MGERKMGGGGGGGRSWEAGDRRTPRRSPECGTVVIGGVGYHRYNVGVWYSSYRVNFEYLRFDSRNIYEIRKKKCIVGRDPLILLFIMHGMLFAFLSW